MANDAFEDPSETAFLRMAAQGRRRAYLRALSEPDGLATLGLERIADGAHSYETAFNLKRDPECPYTFPEEVRLRAAELLYELFLLWKNNKGRMQLRTGALAGKDPEFQRFMVAKELGAVDLQWLSRPK